MTPTTRRATLGPMRPDDGPCRVRRLEAGAEEDPLDLWTGTEGMFRKAGFRVVKDDPARPVLALDLA
ncbi:MAG: hypothetical protein ACE5GW_08645 [Planctomycetota bacterium]